MRTTSLSVCAVARSTATASSLLIPEASVPAIRRISSPSTSVSSFTAVARYVSNAPVMVAQTGPSIGGTAARTLDGISLTR